MTQKREELMRMMKDLKVLLFQAFPSTFLRSIKLILILMN